MAETGAQSAHTAERSILQAVAENTQAHLAYFDPQFNFVYVNAAYARGAGYSQAELTGRNHFELFPDAENRAIFERVRDSGQPATFRAKPFEFPDQPERGITYWDWTLTPIQEAGGEVQGLVLSLLDVTERERAVHERAGMLEQLTTERAQLDALIEHAPVGIMVTDAQARIVRVNPAAERLYARPVPYGEEFDPLPALQILHPDGSPYEPQDYPITRSALQGETHQNVEMRVIWPDGRRRDLLISSAPIRDPQGEIDSAIAVFQDITERKQIEAELEKSQRRLQAIFEHSQDGMLLFDDEGGYVDVNPAAARLLGRRREELLSHSLKDIVPASRLPQAMEVWNRLIADGQIRGEYRLPRSDDSVAMIDYQAVANVVPGLHLMVLRDITARVQMEEALREAYAALERGVQEQTEELIQTGESLRSEIARRERTAQALQDSQVMFESLFEAAPDGILLVNQGGKIVSANQAVESLFGYPRQELLGQPMEMLLPASSRQRHVQHRADYFKQAQTRPMGLGLQLHGRRRDGTHFPMDVTLGPLPTDQGKLIICVIHDISKRTEAQEALRQSEARFRAVFENGPFGIALLDQEGQLIAANPALQKILGYDEAALRGRALSAFLHPEASAEGDFLSDLIAPPNGRSTIEKRFVCRDDKVIWGQVSASLVRDGDNAPLFTICILEDITEQRRTEAELAEVRRRLAQGREGERLLLAQELHDGPLQELHGAGFQIEILLQRLRDEAAKAQLNRVNETLHQVSQGLRDICHELRPSTLIPFGLAVAIRSHAESFAENHPEINVQLELIHDGRTLPEQMRLALFRIYQQALSNVAQHAGAHEVRVQLQLDAEWVMLEIWDDGRGFQVPERWVELARQGHLGLVGASERAEAIGGRLEVISHPGDGTTLQVTAPQPAKAAKEARS